MSQLRTFKKIVGDGKGLMAAAVTVLLCLLLLAWIYRPASVWLQYPLTYQSDGLWNLFIIKTVLQTGWYHSNPLLGAPFEANFLDFAKPETLYLVAYKIAGLFTENVALIHNMFYFAGFVLVALAALFVLRDGFRLSWVLACTGALLYTFLPYHFLRVGHLFLSNYFVIPLAVWLALQVAAKHLPFFDRRRRGRVRIAVVLTALLIASTSIYYTFFGLCVILGTGILEALRQRTWHRLISAALVCGIIIGGLGINLAPSLLHRVNAGANPEVATRALSELNTFALRPAQMLLPNVQHRSASLAEVTQQYTRSISAGGETNSSSLGLIGSIGFLILLVVLIAGDRLGEKLPALGVAARINATILVIAVSGGGGALLALLVSPQFRALNRGSVVIAFVSIAALLLLIDQALRRWCPRHPLIPPLVGILLLTIGLWDQVPAGNRPNAVAIAKSYENDRRFVQAIESNNAPNLKILQYPYQSLPEPAPIYHETPYSQLRGFLHSNTLRWSAGNMRGRTGDNWHRALSQLPLSDLLNEARQAGFGGVWVDRQALADGGNSLDAEFRALGLNKVLTSADASLAFYPMTPSGDKVPELPLAPELGKGFYPWETAQGQRWAWTQGDATLYLVSQAQEVRRVHVRLQFQSIAEREIRVVIKKQEVGRLHLRPGETRNSEFTLDLAPGRTALQLLIDAPAALVGNSDPRKLAMALSGFELTPE